MQGERLMVGRRIVVNVVIFFAMAGFLIALGVTQLLVSGGEGSSISVDFSDASGLTRRNDVTLRGVTVGAVTDVALKGDVARVTLALEPGVEVPNDSQFTATRRSPIGDLVVEITPGDGPAMLHGSVAGADQSTPAPDAGKTIEALADLLHSVPSEDLSTIVTEAARAVRGRGDDLGRLSEVTADLPERILQVRSQLESLMQAGPEVTGILADNADVLADDITRTAQLADILRDRRYDLVDLYRNGAEFTTVAGELIAKQKPNIACMISDFARINTVLSTAKNLSNLAAVLDLNHFFFGGAYQVVQVGLDGQTWFRVQLLPHTEPQAGQYLPQRGSPDVFGANSCTSRYGNGVGPGRQDHNVELAPGSQLTRGK
jgi:virulence factor Mce-like protein